MFLRCRLSTLERVIAAAFHGIAKNRFNFSIPHLRQEVQVRLHLALPDVPLTLSNLDPKFAKLSIVSVDFALAFFGDGTADALKRYAGTGLTKTGKPQFHEATLSGLL
jgi:hypothetical protein